MTLSMALSILFLAAMIWILINPFTLEYQQEKAAEMIDKGVRVKLVEHWWGWTGEKLKGLEIKMNKWKDEIARREYEAEQRQKQQVTEVAAVLGFIGVMMVAVGISWIYLR